MPDTEPLYVVPFGPSTAAPASTGAVPFRWPAMFAIWWWMQFGKTLPSPTISDEPHAFAPRMLPTQPIAWSAYAPELVSASYSLAITDRPAPCEVVSHWAHGKPNPNGSVAACA